jgi:hypothetical protein
VGPPGAGKKDDKHDKSGRRDQEDADNSKSRKKIGKFDRYGNSDKDQDSNHGDSQEAMEGATQNDNYQEFVLPIVAYHQSTGMLQIKETDRDVIVDSQIWDPTTSLIQHKAKQLAVPEDGNPKLLLSEVMGEHIEKQEKEYGLIPNNQILVNGRSDPYLMSKDK